MADKPKRSPLISLLLTLIAIMAAVACVVYAMDNHRKHLYREKWKDYDECGII